MTGIDVFNLKVTELEFLRRELLHTYALIFECKGEDLHIYRNMRTLGKIGKNLLSLKIQKSENFEQAKTEANTIYNDKFLEIYKESHLNNFFYDYCSSEVYKFHFDARFKDFQSEKIDVTIIDFIVFELQKLSDVFNNMSLNIIDKKNLDFVEKSFTRKSSFLSSKATSLGYNI